MEKYVDIDACGRYLFGKIGFSTVSLEDVLDHMADYADHNSADVAPRAEFEALQRRYDLAVSEREAMRTAANSLKMHYKKITEENERLQKANDVLWMMPSVADVKSDTVRKMQEMIKERCIKGGIYPVFVARVIEQVAKEILEVQGTPPDTCVECGEIIPEGRQVCPSCISKTNKKTKKARKESEKRTEN